MTKINIISNLLLTLIKEVRKGDSKVSDKYKLSDKYAKRIDELYETPFVKTPTRQQYKELDELMTYILDEMWGTDEKKIVRESIIAYANKWHEVQSNNEYAIGYNEGANAAATDILG